MAKFEQFIKVGRDLVLLGLTDAGGGTLSVREGDKIFMTRKGAVLGHLTEEDIIELPIDASAGSDDKASKELVIHRAIYKETSFNAVIGANPPFAIGAAALAENKLTLMDQRGQSLLRSVPVVKSRDKGSLDEAVRMIPAIYKSGYLISLVKDYGSFAVGADLFEALQYTSILEQSCKTLAVNKIMTPPMVRPERRHSEERRSAIPPSIGVMDRTRSQRRGFGR